MKGLGLLKDSYHDLEGKTDEIAARAADFVRRNQVHGLIVAGGFVTLFNPGLEAKIAEVMRIPVTSALPSVTAALNSLSVTKVMLVTPFHRRNECLYRKASDQSRLHRLPQSAPRQDPQAWRRRRD